MDPIGSFYSNKNSKILILGNGPSLKNYPFTQYPIDTLGMNLAYRYWHQVNWYPTYYSCMDKNLIRNHHQEMYDLIINAKKYGIKGFFLRDLICDFYPNLKKNLIKDQYNITFAENIRPNKDRGFKNLSNKNTGTWSIRFAIYLGYTSIGLLGIDGYYYNFSNPWNMVDQQQRLLKPIKNNPNYFFDDYQRVGEYFHIPSSKKKDRNTHWIGMKKLQKTFKKSNCTIINCNPQSILYHKKIFQQMEIDKFIQSSFITKKLKKAKKPKKSKKN